MLKYPDLIAQLSDIEKIRILCDIQQLTDKKYKVLGIPSLSIVHIRDLRDAPLPSPVALSNTWDTALIEKAACQQMHRLAEQGVDLAIIPGPRPKVDPYRSALSEDPALAAAVTAAYAQAAKRYGITLCLDGFSIDPSDIPWMDSQPDERAIQQFWIKPYADAVKDIPTAVFLTASDLQIPNWDNINTILVDKLSQRLSPQHAYFVFEEAADKTVQLLTHGGLCFSGSALALETALLQYQQLQKQATDGIITAETFAQAITQGQVISPDTLNESTDRLLQFVFDVKRKPSVSNTLSVSDVALETAHSSITLLKNEDILPASPGTSICLIGDIALQQWADGSSLLSQLENLLTSQGFTITATARGYDLATDRSDDLLSPAIQSAKTADLALVFLGLGKSREKCSYKDHKISIPANQQILLDQLTRHNQNIIAIAPPEFCPDMIFGQRCKAILLSPLDAPYCPQALADVLSGKFNPCGKLASTVYRDTDTLYPRRRTATFQEGLKSGCFIGYRYYDTAGIYPDYPFGHGLSYTKFVYTNLTVSNGIAQITVTNKGKHPGTEIVQLYAQKRNSVILRPQKELAGFGRVELEAGESKTIQISFTLPAVYDLHSCQFVEEAGDYIIYAGASVVDIRLTQTITTTGQPLPPENHNLSAYIQSESNILSDNYKLEAKHKTMKKSLFNFIVGSSALLLAVVLTLYCALSNISGAFFDIFSIILAGGGIYFLVLEVIRRNKLHNQQQEAVDAATTQEFTATNAKSIPVFAAAQMFAREFDSPAETPTQVADAAIEGVETDRLAFIDKDQSFRSAAHDLAVFAAERGCQLSEQTCIELLASLSSSHLMIVRNMEKESFQKLMMILSSYFETSLYLDTVDNTYATPERLLFKADKSGNRSKTNTLCAVQAARSNPHLIHIAALDQVVPAQLSSYFTPFVKYIRNPLGNFHITVPNEHNVDTSYRIPENIWFVLNLSSEATVNELPDFICDVATVNRFTSHDCAANSTYTQVRKFSYYQLEYLTEQAINKVFVAEEQWKKIDELDAHFSQNGVTVLDNKLWLCLEKYIHVYLSCDCDPSKALDHAICSKLMAKMLQLANHADGDQTLTDVLEHALSEEGSIACKQMLQDCGAGPA